jgi:hypothetical protein
MLSAGAQQSLGNSGLLNTPSADFNPDGTFSLGINYLPTKITPDYFDYPTANYFLNLTYFSFLELTFRMTLMKIEANNNKYSNQDRAMSVRLKLINESKFIPAVVIGADDFLTSDFISVIDDNDKNKNQYFGSLYVVTTKNLDVHASNIGLTLGYAIPTERTHNNGILAGVRFNPSFYCPLSIIAEYDTKYVNLGVSALLFNHLNLQCFVTDFKALSAGISYRIQLKTFDKIRP